MNNLLHLDIYVHILNQLEVSRTTDESVKVLANCLQTSSTLREAAILSSIWKPHYNSRYRYCDAEREARRKEDNCGDWRLMYAERRRLDRCVLCLTDEIVHERIGRGERAKLLNSAYGFDAWDVLELEARRPVPDPFQEHDENVTAPPQTITRRFWAKQVLGVIARHHALSLWGRLINSRDNDALSFEDSISALSSFFGHPVAEV
jgi:F-box protein 21